MKTANIKVGTDYAYYPYKYAGGRQVTVLETGVPEKQGRYYSSRTVKSGVRIKFVTGSNAGTERVVSSRTIERLWSEQEVLNENARLAKKAGDEAKRVTAARRANLAKRLEARLEAHGVSVGHYAPTFRHAPEQHAALVAAGFETTTSIYGDKDAIVTRVTNLDDLMRYGRVAERDVEFLLADVEVTA